MNSSSVPSFVLPWWLGRAGSIGGRFRSGTGIDPNTCTNGICTDLEVDRGDGISRSISTSIRFQRKRRHRHTSMVLQSIAQQRDARQPRAPSPAARSKSPSCTPGGNTIENEDNGKVGFSLSVQRRDFVRYVPMLCLFGLPSGVRGQGQVHSEFSELASRLPGVGKADIYYPVYFLGDWVLNRVLYAVEAVPEVEASKSRHSVLSAAGVARLRSAVGVRQQYGTRFMEFRGHVVEDRKSCARVEIGLPLSENERDRERVECAWTPDNPNVLSVSWGKGFVREVKVTKRAFSQAGEVKGDASTGRDTRASTTFAASEYARVADLAGQGALIGVGDGPSVYGRRRLTRCAVRFSGGTSGDGGDQGGDIVPVGIDRFVTELVYAASGTGAGAGERALVTLKYRDFLRRK